MDDPTPMDRPLCDQPEVETVHDDDKDTAPHLRERQKGTSTEEDYLKFIRDSLVTNNPVETKRLPPKDLIGRSFLMPPNEDGEHVRAKIVQLVGKMRHQAHQHPEYVKVKCRVNDKYDEVVAYNDIVDYIEKDQTWDSIWNWNRIKAHKGPFKPSDPEYKGSKWNLLMEWENGEETWEPLFTAKKDGIGDQNAVEVALYAKENDLLNTPGWMSPRIRSLAKSQKKLIRTANQAKLHSFRTKPIYMYRFLVPRNHEQASYGVGRREREHLVEGCRARGTWSN